LGDPAQIVLFMIERGNIAFLLGDWTGAQRDLEAAVALSRPLGANAPTVWLLLNLGLLSLAKGEWEMASRYLEESSALAAQSADLLQARRCAGVALAELDLLAGRPAAARERLTLLLDRPGLEERDVIMLLPRLAWAHLDLGDVPTAETIAAQAATRARTTANRLALMDALLVRALVQIRRRHWAEAEQAVEEALARDMRHPYGEARVLHAYGDLRHAKGESGRARVCWEAARAIFQRLGARAEAARVDTTITAA